MESAYLIILVATFVAIAALAAHALLKLLNPRTDDSR